MKLELLSLFQAKIINNWFVFNVFNGCVQLCLCVCICCHTELRVKICILRTMNMTHKMAHHEPLSLPAATRSTFFCLLPLILSPRLMFPLPSISVSISDSGSESRGSVKLHMYLQGTYAAGSPFGELNKSRNCVFDSSLLLFLIIFFTIILFDIFPKKN